MSQFYDYNDVKSSPRLIWNNEYVKTEKEPLQDLLVNKRLETLKLAQKLGNVSEACRVTGMDRTSFYEWRKRFNSKGVMGLGNKSSAPKKHPFTTPGRISLMVVQIALQRPEWGCIRIANNLAEKNISISSPTVQKILIQHQLGKRGERLFVLEKILLTTRKLENSSISDFENMCLPLNTPSILNKHQMDLIHKANPSLCELDQRSKQPGEQVIQDIILIGKSKLLGHLYLQTALDSYHLRAFAYIHRRKHPQDAIFLLRNKIQPHYKGLNYPLLSICTDEGTDYVGGSKHPFQKYLQTHNISHRTSGDKRRNTNGHLRRFTDMINKQFLNGIQSKLDDIHSIQEIQYALDDWLKHYNNSAALPGFPNFGISAGKREAAMFALKTSLSNAMSLL